MGLASIRTVVLGSFAFMVFWVLAIFPSCKLLPIGRTAGALAGAVLCVVFQVETPSNAFSSVDLPILGLLFGTMAVSVYLDRAGMFQCLGKLILWKSKGGKDLLCRVCILSAIASALFSNDTCCLVLTEFVLKLCKEKSLPPKPFIIALATSSNIGSAATLIGNPQNLIVGVLSGISFGQFLAGLLPAMVLGVFVNTILLLSLYWRQLSPLEDTEIGKGSFTLVGEGQDKLSVCSWTPFTSGSHKNCRWSFHETIADDAYPKHYFPPFDNADQAAPFLEETHDEYNIAALREFQSAPTSESDNAQTENRQECAPLLPFSSSSSDASKADIRNGIICSKAPSRSSSSSSSASLYGEEETMFQKVTRVFRKSSAYVVTTAMLAALLYGLNISWSALTAAVALMILDFQDAETCIEKVSYPLLAFFSGMFITVDGFNQTGIPGTFWDSVEPHARINSTTGIVILALVVIVLSNVASNVPTVLLLGARVSLSASASGASVTKAWLILAWTSTIAGNLTLVGSAANLIVSEQARKAQFFGYELTFWSHLMFGFPSTLIVAAVGLPLIKG